MTERLSSNGNKVAVGPQNWPGLAMLGIRILTTVKIYAI